MLFMRARVAKIMLHQALKSFHFAFNIRSMTGIWAYEPSICRSLGASYKSKTKYNGIPVLIYEMDIGEEMNIKQCFCRDLEDPDSCPPKGTFDLYRCSGTNIYYSKKITNFILIIYQKNYLGMPMFGSLPHFYNADPKLLEGFESGLYPSKDIHGIQMLFETVGVSFDVLQF